MNRRLWTTSLQSTAMLVIGLATAPLLAQLNAQFSKSSSPPASSSSARMAAGLKVVAVVNSRSLLSAEVDQILQQVPFHDATVQQRMPVIDLAIQRLLVLDYLKERQLGATAPEVDLAMRRWEQHLTAHNVSVADYYARHSLDEPAVRRRFEWKIGWNRYRNKHLTDASLAKFFANHREEFDGTRRRVAHILLEDQPEPQAAMDEAISLRTNISRGELTFSDAARRFSVGATADRGGEIGWISATGPMAPTFTRAAFKLEGNELSVPTRSPFGVHLIQCLEVETGTATLTDVLPKVRNAAERHLFQTAVKKQRPKSSVALR